MALGKIFWLGGIPIIPVTFSETASEMNVRPAYCAYNPPFDWL